MDTKEFLEEMTDLMDTEEELSMETALADIEEWDSLSRVAFLAFCTRHGAQDVTPKDVQAAKSMKDLYLMVEA